ncbi:MAG: site-specific integrase [Mycobacterium sp.]|uniref:site-specific integrase n=1 Tax=Mycobacterium sp. TaxID=1785 RepID=UPI001EC21188|nr:site-specific integrase [Mycobacterium sp.]MBW0018164.1 site-specific integrase [Mycobacterium sp.]
MWLVVDDAYEVHRVATDFCLALDGANRASNTVRSYAPKVAKFLTWSSANGLDWTALPFADLTRYKRFIERELAVDDRPRSGRTTNLYLIVLCEFLRFASREDLVGRVLVDRSSDYQYEKYANYWYSVAGSHRPGQVGGYFHAVSGATWPPIPATLDWSRVGYDDSIGVEFRFGKTSTNKQ